MKLEKEVQLYDYAYDILDFAEGFTEEERKTLKQMHHKKVKLTLEVEEPILDEAERKYLSSVIRPFRDRVKCVKKEKDTNKREYINIVYDNDWLIPLPFFEKNTMYKDMELDKEYSLEDLNL